MSDLPWYQTFFDEDYLRMYAPFLPKERTLREVENLIRLLNLSPQSMVLDLCCGTGRHTIPLARQGMHMVGLDLSKTLLYYAQNEAETANIAIQWVNSDMRRIPFEQKFDAIINIFTSFGYLEDDEEDQKVLQQVQRALKPNGLFLLESVYQPRVLRSFTSHGILRYDDGLIVFEERHFDLAASRNEVLATLLYPDGRRIEHKQSMRVYTLTELTHMLEKAGLQLQASYGALDASPLTLDSRLVLIARNPQ